MTRIAVLGANGQVGAELCLLLAQQPGIEVVPICRSRFGSAYLRYRGLQCRHGQLHEAAAARELIGDCDVVANLVLVAALTNPQAARRLNAQLLECVFAQSAPHAAHIYFSTMSVYGDAQVGQRLVARNSYGQDKRRGEKIARAAAQRANRKLTILRLGHVCGELQGISQQLRRRLGDGAVQVADPERYSNTVQVATIAEAVLKVAAGTMPTGIFDLMNVPQWTWRQVLAYEARQAGIEARLDIVGDPPRASIRQFTREWIASVVSNLPVVRRVGSRLMMLLPSNHYRAARTAYAIRSAAAEIGKLRPSPSPFEAMLRVPVGNNGAPGLTDTAVLLQRREFQIAPDPSIAFDRHSALAKRSPAVA